MRLVQVTQAKRAAPEVVAGDAHDRPVTETQRVQEVDLRAHHRERDPLVLDQVVIAHPDVLLPEVLELVAHRSLSMDT
jgi:hypothetical protein